MLCVYLFLVHGWCTPLYAKREYDLCWCGHLSFLFRYKFTYVTTFRNVTKIFLDSLTAIIFAAVQLLRNKYVSILALLYTVL